MYGGEIYVESDGFNMGIMFYVMLLIVLFNLYDDIIEIKNFEISDLIEFLCLNGLWILVVEDE